MTNTITYKNSGVDINAGNALVPVIKSIAQHTQRPEVLTGIGGFGALCELPPGYKQPVLVSGTDGVGTKLKLALDTGRLESIGIDLVAMCANDILVSGAQPLFFLDYYATGQLDLKTAETIIRGIGEGCKQAGCALVGGETAEMPGLYTGSDFDLAGFCVGVAEKSEIITGDRVKPGDALIALASSGPHSNGYSLIRAILRQQSSDQMLEGKPLLEHLITPTRIYVQSILTLMKQIPIHAMAHITGGGIVDNLPRTLPDHVTAIVDRQSWRLPPVFQWLRKMGPVDDQEMLNTFNCGVGMIVCVAGDQVDAALDLLQSLGETAWRIGKIVERDQAPVQFSGTPVFS